MIIVIVVSLPPILVVLTVIIDLTATTRYIILLALLRRVLIYSDSAAFPEARAKVGAASGKYGLVKKNIAGKEEDRKGYYLVA